MFTSLLQSEGCKKDTHDDTLTYKVDEREGEKGEEGGVRVGRFEKKWTALVM